MTCGSSLKGGFLLDLHLLDRFDDINFNFLNGCDGNASDSRESLKMTIRFMPKMTLK